MPENFAEDILIFTKNEWIAAEQHKINFMFIGSYSIIVVSIIAFKIHTNTIPDGTISNRQHTASHSNHSRLWCRVTLYLLFWLWWVLTKAFLVASYLNKRYKNKILELFMLQILMKKQ